MKKLFYLLFFFLPFIGISQTRTGVIFYDDCEDAPVRYGTATTSAANFSLGYSWIYANNSSQYGGTITSVNTYARKGSRSYYHYLPDLAGSQYNTWEWLKAEMAWGYAPAGTPAGTDGANNRPNTGLNWFAYSTLIPANNNDNITITSLGLTMKHWPDNYTTPQYLSMENGRYFMFITRVRPDNSLNGTLKIDCGPVIKDQWVDWAIHRNFTNQDSGYIRIYKNKQQIYEYLGGNFRISSSYSREPYFMVGLYKWAFRSDWGQSAGTNFTNMYIDEVRIGNYSSNLESVSPDFVGGGANVPPVVNAGPSIDYVSSTVSVPLSATASDADGTITTIQWTQRSGPNTATFSSTSVLNPTVSNFVPGLYKFRITVTDNNLATAFSEVDIKINKLPVINLLSPTEYQNNTDSIRLSFTVSDPDGTIVAFQVTQLTGPTTGTFSNPNAVTTDFTDLLPGDYRIRASATDNTGETAIEEWELRIRDAARIRIRKISKIEN